MVVVSVVVSWTLVVVRVTGYASPWAASDEAGLAGKGLTTGYASTGYESTGYESTGYESMGYTSTGGAGATG